MMMMMMMMCPPSLPLAKVRPAFPWPIGPHEDHHSDTASTDHQLQPTPIPVTMVDEKTAMLLGHFVEAIPTQSLDLKRVHPNVRGTDRSK
jgi:hypothetical protein